MSKLGLLFCVAFFACHDDAQRADAGGGKASNDQVFERYARIKADAVKVDVASFATGDVSLAKGRRIAPVLHVVHVDWAKEERALGDESGEAAHLLNRLSTPRAPYCPGNDLALCNGHPWFADDPAAAGVIVYVEQRTAKGGTYGGSANAYTTALQFDAVVVPEKLRVARWWRLALPPESQVTTRSSGAGMMIGRQTGESFEGDMQKLSVGTAPVGDLDDPWREAGARR